MHLRTMSFKITSLSIGYFTNVSCESEGGGKSRVEVVLGK